MRARVFLGLPIVMLLIGLTVAAQDDAGEQYRLRVPTAEEYLSALPDIGETMERQVGDIYNNHYDALLLTFTQELKVRYADVSAVPFEVLHRAEPYISRWAFYQDDLIISQKGWHNAVFEAWLRDNRPDLSAQEVWQFEAYTLVVAPVDFSGDGVDELVATLVFQPEEHPEYEEYMVLVGDDDSTSGYRRDERSFWYSSGCYIHFVCAGSGEVWGLEDVNADGLPEWLMSTGYSTTGRFGVSLRIFGWRDGAMVELIPRHDDGPFYEQPSGGGGPPSVPPEGTWTFTNLDDDPALELVQQDAFVDDRDCQIEKTRIFDWHDSEDTYIGDEIEIDYEDSAGCALRLAHFAMRDLDWLAAINHYERVLELMPDNGDDFQREARQYAQVRLAAANALAGQGENALALLESLQSQTPESPVLEALITDSYQTYVDAGNPVKLCAALHAVFVDGYNTEDDSYWWFDTKSHILRYGQINDLHIPRTYVGGDFSPNTTGCNLSGLWDKTVETLDVDTPVDEQLTAVGWDVADEFVADLNDDGVDDRLIWPLGLKNSALFVISTGDNYTISTTSFHRPDETAELATIQLPGDAGIGLVQVSFENPEHPCSAGYSPGDLRVWRLEGGEFISIGSAKLCERRRLEEIFVSPDQFLAWQWSQWGEYFEVTHFWDQQEQEYVFDTLPKTEPGPGHSTSYCPAPYDYCGFGLVGVEAVAALDELLANPPEDAGPEFLQTVAYYRAWRLEELGRDDEALAQYVAIYEDAPNSVWGMLAALHFEIIE